MILLEDSGGKRVTGISEAMGWIVFGCSAESMMRGVAQYERCEMSLQANGIE